MVGVGNMGGRMTRRMTAAGYAMRNRVVDAFGDLAGGIWVADGSRGVHSG
jgi:3-hydroxyisobutyrate dehydrogenase-like beta-hydroxyacid dehydrogenase